MSGYDFSDYPNVARGHQYALDVVEGKIPASIYVIGTCKRYLEDLEDNFEWYFDPEAAEHFLRLVQKFHHVKGNWDSPYILYAPWQCFVFMNIMGFYLFETEARRFRTAHIEIGRGNGKSAMASQAALYFNSLIPNRNGNEVSCVATKKDQARIVLDAARMMADKNVDFKKATKTRVLAHKIVQDHTNSNITALSSDRNTNDGRADILAIVDELHAMSKKTFDVVDTGMSKRKDSLLLCITTAGHDVEGIGFSQSNYAKKVGLGEMRDETFFSFVCTIDPDDDPWEEKNWYKANPNLGISVDPVNFRAKAEKARRNPQDAANFKIKHLNIWISEANAFFDVKAFKKCANPSLKLEDFRGHQCFVGIDLASKVDLTSIAYVFYKDEKYYIFDKSFIPEKTVREAKRAIYDECIAKGYLQTTPGNAIDYKTIRETILQDSRIFKFQDVMFDPWNATEFSQKLAEYRLSMVEFRMNTSNLSEPTKSFDALIKDGKVVYNGSPLLTWTLGNVVAKEDPASNVYPKKSHEKLKIDPIIAILMAFAGWTQREIKQSVYETRGIRAL